MTTTQPTREHSKVPLKNLLFLENSKLTLRSGKASDPVRSEMESRHPVDPALTIHTQPLPFPERCQHPRETNLAGTQGQCDAQPHTRKQLTQWCTRQDSPAAGPSPSASFPDFLPLLITQLMLKYQRACF